MKKYSIALLCIMLYLCQFSVALGTKDIAYTEEVSDDIQEDYGFSEGTVTWIVPGKAGGGSDLAIRCYSEAMMKLLGISNFVVNCDTNTEAHSLIAHAKPDGSYLMLATAALNIQFITYHATVNPKTDLTLIAAMQDNGFAALCAPVKAPYNTFDEMVQYAKEHPGKLKAGFPEAGNNSFQFALIEKETGAVFSKADCPSEADRLVHLASRFIDLGFVTLQNAIKYERDGKLKVIATMAGDGKRIIDYERALPDNYKTMQEQGYKGCFWNVQHYVYGPAGMDAVLVDKINRTLKVLYDDETCRNKIASLGQIPEWHDIAESLIIRDAEYDAEVAIAKFLDFIP
ncbi:MAG: hypothetical protein K6E51_09420 [Treponema sp.]|nr:hypothetical protein [Treponema sp.]